MADDEDNPTTFLRVYRNGQPGGPLAAIPLSGTALQLDTTQDLEMDVEAAAQVGDRISWIGKDLSYLDSLTLSRGEARALRLILSSLRLCVLLCVFA